MIVSLILYKQNDFSSDKALNDLNINIVNARDKRQCGGRSFNSDGKNADIDFCLYL